MEYLKCPWCGSPHNRYENKCPNCGGALKHKSDFHKAILKHQGKNINELISEVKKIAVILVSICLILVIVAVYYLYSGGPDKSEVIHSASTSVQPIQQTPLRKVRPSLESGPLSVTNKRTAVPVKHDACTLDIDTSSNPGVYLVSSYKGLGPSQVQFGESGHEVRTNEVIVNKSGESIVLVLMAYDPVVWKIKKTYSSNVVGVVLAGYHDQVMLGLPKSTPVLEAIYEKKTACKYIYGSLSPGGQKHYVAKRIEDIAGSRPVEYITAPHEGKFYVGSNKLNSALIAYTDTKLATELKKQLGEGELIDTVAPKDEGLMQLMREGKIRLASTTDIDDWSAVASQHNNGGRHRMRAGRTYVILKQMQFPRGMFGAHARSFILEEDVPVPTGHIAHNTVYLMSGGVCMGAGCNF
jgi:hypothetical protein